MSAMILRGILIFAVFLVAFSLQGFYSPIRLLKINSALTPHHLKMDYEMVPFKTAGGLTLSGWFISFARAATKTMVLSCGCQTNKGNILPTLAFLPKISNF